MPEGSNPEPKPNGPWWLRPLTYLFGMKPEEQGRAVGLLLTIGAVVLVWVLLQQSTRLNDERFSMMLRVQQDDREKDRADRAAADEKYRTMMKDLSEKNLESDRRQSIEMGKLQATLATFVTAAQDLKLQVQHLGSMIGKLKKGDFPEFTPEAELAPMPKLFDKRPGTGPVITES